jgi:hypothetical protein
LPVEGCERPEGRIASVHRLLEHRIEYRRAISGPEGPQWDQ